MKRSRSPTARRDHEAAREPQSAASGSENECVAATKANQLKTVPVKACRICGAGLYLPDNFCRRCGARQTCDLAVDRQDDAISLPLRQSSMPEQARSLVGIYHPVSGPLVKAMVESVSANLTTQPRGRLVQNIMQALVSIPIWLAFVLLSPLDAFAAARTIYKRL